MKEARESMYQANEFASVAGVTVRTLHHYDRIGLLKPSGYTSAGFRLYRKEDLVRLQQIVTLKFIGFSLRQIKELLNRSITRKKLNKRSKNARARYPRR